MLFSFLYFLCIVCLATRTGAVFFLVSASGQLEADNKGVHNSQATLHLSDANTTTSFFY
jgi:hypothetical protein